MEYSVPLGSHPDFFDQRFRVIPTSMPKPLPRGCRRAQIARGELIYLAHQLDLAVEV
jgi:hypothetical protein